MMVVMEGSPPYGRVTHHDRMVLNSPQQPFYKYNE